MRRSTSASASAASGDGAAAPAWGLSEIFGISGALGSEAAEEEGEAAGRGGGQGARRWRGLRRERLRQRLEGNKATFVQRGDREPGGSRRASLDTGGGDGGGGRGGGLGGPAEAGWRPPQLAAARRTSSSTSPSRSPSSTASAQPAPPPPPTTSSARAWYVPPDVRAASASLGGATRQGYEVPLPSAADWATGTWMPPLLLDAAKGVHAPAVALHFLPNMDEAQLVSLEGRSVAAAAADEDAELFEAEQLQELLAAYAPAHAAHELAPEVHERAQSRRLGEDREFHRRLWLQAEQGAFGPTVAQMPRLSWKEIASIEMGDAATHPYQVRKLLDFTHGMFREAGVDYQSQSIGVPIPGHRPDYGTMLRDIGPLAAPGHPNAGIGGALFGAPPPDLHAELLGAFEENAKVREALAQDVRKMIDGQHDLAAKSDGEPSTPSLPDGASLQGGGGGDRPSPLGRSMISLRVQVIKLTGLPQVESFGIWSRNAFVEVSVVDADPFSEAARAGWEKWYSDHEIWHETTPVAHDSHDPRWDAQFHTGDHGILPHEEMYVHFRVFDDSFNHLQGTPIGQVAIRLDEVLGDAWYVARAAALLPFDPRQLLDKKGLQKEYAALRRARLYVAIQHEGAKAHVHSAVSRFREGQPATARIRRQHQQDEEAGQGLFAGLFG